MIHSNSLLQKNLLALSTIDPELSTRLKLVEPHTQMKCLLSRTGMPVPVYTDDNGKNFSLHSLFDPVREGNRLAQDTPEEGYIVFLGLGAAYHILPILEKAGITDILIVEHDLSVLYSLLGYRDLSRLIIDPRVKILMATDEKIVQSYILNTYIPAVSGDLNTRSPKSIFSIHADFFTQVLNMIRTILGTLADDYTVQVHFGRKWFKNTLANIPHAEKTTTVLKPVKTAYITAAGPSLEDQIPLLKEIRSKGFLIATDTSVPVLLNNDIMPDAVISIDCQQISYHHFLSGFPKGIPLILDLASPTDLTVFTNDLVFFTSGHPFSQYVNHYWRPFPRIDITGGNVSHAAISLAEKLGAKEVSLFGVDFSYPEGKTYSRGTYVYSYFATLENRYKPIESQAFHFLLRNSSIKKTRRGSYFLYTTRPMLSYKERLEAASLNFQTKIIHIPGKGVPLSLPFPLRKSNLHSPFFAAGRPNGTGIGFLKMYRDVLIELPEIYNPLAAYLSELSSEEKDVITTLLPTAATFRGAQDKNSPVKGHILETVKRWSLEVIEQYLDC